MNTCPTSKRRPLQLVVDHSELDSERPPLLKIALRELHQFIQPLAEISVGERPSEASRVMCILSLRLGFISRFISEMRHSRSWGTIGIFSMCGRFFGGWMGVFTMPQRTAVCSVILYIYPALGDRGRTIVLALLGTIGFTLGALVALANRSRRGEGAERREENFGLRRGSRRGRRLLGCLLAFFCRPRRMNVVGIFPTEGLVIRGQ